MLVGDRPILSAPVLAVPENPMPAEGSKVRGKAKALTDPVPVSPCSQCIRAEVECTFKLVKAKMEYWQVAEVGESCDKETTGKETGDENMEGEVEEGPESDPKVKTENHTRTLTIYQDTRLSIKCEVKKHYKVREEGLQARRTGDWKMALSAGQRCEEVEETGDVVLVGVCEKERSGGPNQAKVMTRMKQATMTAAAYPKNGWE
ncbi:hypothetical protein EDC04DRAFT_2615901 [Pisolithus marmoratus]|nr:hypothetical protein EDC04DRAFT_2615901 [Pisolithus marmoratus]